MAAFIRSRYCDKRLCALALHEITQLVLLVCGVNKEAEGCPRCLKYNLSPNHGSM